MFRLFKRSPIAAISPREAFSRKREFLLMLGMPREIVMTYAPPDSPEVPMGGFNYSAFCDALIATLDNLVRLDKNRKSGVSPYRLFDELCTAIPLCPYCISCRASCIECGYKRAFGKCSSLGSAYDDAKTMCENDQTTRTTLTEKHIKKAREILYRKV